MAHFLAPLAPTLRCFIGLALDEENSAALREHVSAVLDDRDWKLHECEDYHLTLCFLGEIDTGCLPTLRSTLSAALRGLVAPQLTLTSIGSFGGSVSPRVLWAAVAASAADFEHLSQLRRQTAAAIEAARLTWDSAESFTPHVTVARPRRRTAVPEACAALAFDLRWSPQAVTLFGSVPGARPHYPKLESFDLG